MDAYVIAWKVLRKMRERKLEEANKKGLLRYAWNRMGRLVPVRLMTFDELFPDLFQEEG